MIIEANQEGGDLAVLFIEPTLEPAAELVDDELTRLMIAALNQSVAGTGFGERFTPGDSYRGVHTCSCGAVSTACDYQLPGGLITNSLAVHYLTVHRREVPSAELEKVLSLAGHVSPANDETILRLPSRW